MISLLTRSTTAFADDDHIFLVTVDKGTIVNIDRADNGDYVYTWYNDPVETLIKKFMAAKKKKGKKNLFEIREFTDYMDIGMQFHSIFNNNIISSKPHPYDGERLDESLSE